LIRHRGWFWVLAISPGHATLRGRRQVLYHYFDVGRAGDVDLHTFEPNGAHVYYAQATGTSGFLDTDNTVANGPEHYVATCDTSRLQTGSYRIAINNYSSATGRTATVQAASLVDGALLTVMLDVGPELGSGGNASPIGVMTVTVTRDVTTGEYQVQAN
jgi:uncharacterized protein YfaP (DUF2135 family)